MCTEKICHAMHGVHLAKKNARGILEYEKKAGMMS